MKTTSGKVHGCRGKYQENSSVEHCIFISFSSFCFRIHIDFHSRLSFASFVHAIHSVIYIVYIYRERERENTQRTIRERENFCYSLACENQTKPIQLPNETFFKLNGCKLVFEINRILRFSKPFSAFDY